MQAFIYMTCADATTVPGALSWSHTGFSISTCQSSFQEIVLT